MTVALSATAFAATDTQGHWANSVLTKWENQGLLVGYPDGTIRPDQTITRAEFAALDNRIAGFPAAGAPAAFNDVQLGEWYAGDVATAVAQGYMSGYGNGFFGPNDVVTREQAAVMIAKQKGLTVNEARAYTFADGAACSGWALGYIGAVADAGYMIGDTANMFHPMTPLTRAEAVSALDRVFEIQEAPVQGGEPTEPTTPATQGELSVTLSAGNGSLTKNAVKTVTYQVSDPNATITAVSSDETVATVEVKDGKIEITGVKNGDATITVTATTEDGQTATATYAVKVQNVTTSSGGGGSSSSRDKYNGIIPEANITVDGTFTKSDLQSGNFDTKGNDNVLTLVNNTGKTLKVTEITIPAGTTVKVTLASGKEVTVDTTADITRDTESVEFLTVAELKAAVKDDSDAYAKLQNLSDDKHLVTGTANADGTEITFDTHDNGTITNWDDVYKKLVVTVKGE